MIYRNLGGSGLHVSAVALGCEGFAGMDEAEAKSLMDFAIANGVNFIDIYASDPGVRSRIGAALRGRRDGFVIQGHIGSTWKNGQYERTRDLGECRAAFADLLTRLETDQVDVGMIHYCDEERDFQRIVAPGGLLDYADELRAAGRIRAIGVSSHNPVVARKLVETGRIEVLMFSVNPCYDLQPPGEDVEQLWADETYTRSYRNFDPERTALYELCERRGVGIDVMKVYAGGDLLKADQSMFGVAMTPVQALEYALSRPAVAAVMAGCRSREELQAALDWCTASREERDYSVVLSKADKCSWTGHCMYCGHCAPCPAGIGVADVNKFLNLALAQGQLPETVREHYKALDHHASECIRCGACERRCPFGVPVRDRMAQAVRIFGE